MSSVRPSANQFIVIVDGDDVVEHDRGVLTSMAAAQFPFDASSPCFNTRTHVEQHVEQRVSSECESTVARRLSLHCSLPGATN